MGKRGRSKWANCCTISSGSSGLSLASNLSNDRDCFLEPDDPEYVVIKLYQLACSTRVEDLYTGISESLFKLV